MSNDDKKTITLKSSDGAIVFIKNSTKTGEQEFIIPEEETDWGDSIRETMAFFMYATQREDWVLEFREKMDYLIDVLTDIEESVTKGKSRGHLRLVEKDDEGDDNG